MVLIMVSCDVLVPRVVLTGLQCGSACRWYRRENVGVCDELLPHYSVGGRSYPQGYYAEVGWYNPMADYRCNSWEGGIVDGPFATEGEAMAAAEAEIERRCEDEAGDSYSVGC